MQDCVRCKNHSICRLEHRNIVEKCAFVNPTDEIPIIHGKAELDLHDKEIRNKVIDEFANHLNIQFFIEDDVLFDKVMIYKIVNKIAEQMKGGV